ncbi:coiled-coil domain-containing protein 115-like isoform X3 [Penaeus japonicus]|nr:coiled-coil domain-containing protein 115-like isoform X3 [Penaeus japonicus]XP_042892111.1 coiled-coil domain-containing protein 115-like isoform X3 [Penaeus japonicus]XP_042892112.1 coiled-coil domain-containing protein 115-like isoform X3 [Penaeus japonicus]
MATGIQMTREALCDGLDHMALQHLTLMDQLIRTKMILEEHMRSGFFLLGKTRYVLGCNAISTLQLPTEEREVDPLVSVISTPVRIEKYDGEVIYQEMNTQFADPIVSLPVEAEEESMSDMYAHEGDPVEGLRQRISNLRGDTELEEDREDDREQYSTEQIKKKVINRDPIRWFSVLPPQTLKQAQSDFKTAIQISAKCATLLGQLKVVCNEYKRLAKIKSKVDNIEKES